MTDKQIKLIRIVSGIIRIFSVVFFVAFIIFSIVIGGDAINGFYENGLYYVASHGNVTEVGFDVWISNLILEIATIVMILAEISMEIFLWKTKKKRDNL